MLFEGIILVCMAIPMPTQQCGQLRDPRVFHSMKECLGHSNHNTGGFGDYALSYRCREHHGSEEHEYGEPVRPGKRT